MQNSKWLFEAVRGMPTMIIPGFTLRHARTVASCASSSVKSHVPSNKATPRIGGVVPTLLTSRFSCCILDWGFRFGHISSIFLSNGQTHPARNRLRRLGIEHHPIEKPFRNVERLRHVFSRFQFLSRHESMGRNLALRALSGFVNELETRPPGARLLAAPAL